MSDPASLSDEDLLQALSTGDDSALVSLAGRYAAGVYDFALRSTMDEAQAAEITQIAFDKLRQISELPPQIDFRTWLFSLALVEVLALGNEKQSSRVSVEDRRFIQSQEGSDREVLLWAWQAARGLRTRDYCVLDLTLRRGLSPEELADSASLTRNNLYASIGRARGAFEETFGATVLYMRGRRLCPQLETIVSSAAGGSVRAALRHQIADHADVCDTCRKTLATLPLAADVFAALQDVELPSKLPEQLLGEQQVAQPALAVADMDSDAETAEPVVADEAAYATSDVGRPASASPATPLSYEDISSPRDPAAMRSLRDRAKRPSLTERFAAWIGAVRGQPIVWSWVIGGVATVVAIYIALAIGDSLQGGGGSSGAVPLQTAGAGAAIGRVIDCPTAITLDQGTSSLVSFDAKSLDGYQLAGLGVQPKSRFAEASGLKANIADPYSISFQAARTQATAARADEYGLSISWRKGQDVATSACSVSVQVGGASP